MAANKPNFIIKNGLTVGGTNVIAANGAWIGASSGLIGPQGPTGAQGTQGTAGVDGPTGIVSSATAPANTSILWLDTTAQATVAATSETLHPFLLMGA